MTGKAPSPSAWADCHCCGRTYPAQNVVRFYRHPEDAICVTCIDWLYARGRPIARRLWPVWQLPARIRYRFRGAR